MPSTLLSVFSQVSDLHRDQGKMYPLAPILLFTVLAMLAGARSYDGLPSAAPSGLPSAGEMLAA